MADTVVTAATGVMNSLLSKLSELLTEQYMQRKGVRRDIGFLCHELTSMNAALEKLAGMEKLDIQTKVWRDKVREMAYDIEDSVDIFKHKLAQEDDDKDGLFHKIARKARELRLHYQLANKIQELRARVEDQSQSRDRYKIDESIPESRVVEVDPRLPAMYEDAKRLVGIDGPREEIINRLMEQGDSESGRLKVLSIVGFGGLGKTTLANQVYAKIKNEFERTAFVSVSRTPHMPKIMKDILSELKFDVKELDDDVNRLINILREQLTNKRYFVIIDDLWRIKDWRTVECAFVENNNASRVIITTRIQGVAIASCIPSQGRVFQMQPLNKLHSRRLFFKRLFDTEDSCPEHFREISDQILRKCKGVPLAIISIASLLASYMHIEMASYMHIEMWERIRNSLGSELDTNPTLDWMRHVLSLSYNDLSHELKTCLLYLGMYPEDYRISKEDIVRKWMAEGFIGEKNGLDLEEAAENCFNELINRNMIQPCFDEYSFGEVWACQVHDLVLDVIILKCKEENFITIIDKKYPMNGASQVRRISHQFHDRGMHLTLESMSASTVRSYISFTVADCMPPLSKFQLLRVLDMQREHSMDHMSHMSLDLSAINHLFLLRYVRVDGFRLKLPKKFGKLKHLMTLEMFQPWKYDSQLLLSDFSSLSSLRHLRTNVRLVLKNGLSMLCNLRVLSGLDIEINSIECIRDLGELTNLRSLGVSFREGFENNAKMTILAASLNKLGNSNLRLLEFDGYLTEMSLSAQFWSNCLTPPRHLHKLIIGSILLLKLPNWIAHAARLAHAQLYFHELRSDDNIQQVLGQLPCLTYLGLTTRAIPENSIIIHPNTFHSLKSFKFYCDELPRLTFEPAAMPRLQRLKVEANACEQGAIELEKGSLVSGIEHLASLEEISLCIAEAKYSQFYKIESAWRDAISRHPKSQAIKIEITCEDETTGGEDY